MAGHNRFAETVRLAMRTSNNPTGEPMSIRKLSETCGYSYEHTRKLIAGEPTISREFCDAVSAALGLDADQMWDLAQEAKGARKFGLARLPKDARLEAIWSHLTDTDRNRLVLIAEAYAEANKALAEQADKRKRRMA